MIAVEIGRTDILRCLLDTLSIPGKQLREALTVAKSVHDKLSFRPDMQSLTFVRFVFLQKNMDVTAPILEEGLRNLNPFVMIMRGKTKAVRIIHNLY